MQEKVERPIFGATEEQQSGNKMLEDLGYKPELSRDRSTMHVAFMAFVLASVPYGLTTSLNWPLVGGGPVNIIWGWLLVSVLVMCVAVSLGEITSVYPTAGGVYHQTFMLSPPRFRRVISWICGWLYLVGNISITLSVNFGTTLFFVSCINVFESEPGVGIFAGKPYQVILIFIAITLLCNSVSALGNKWLPWLDTAAIFWTFVSVLAITITVLVIAKNGRRDAEYVFTHFESSSGWPDGWSFCVGLLHAGYATSSTGMITSMCEEVRQPSIQVPRAMVSTVFINTVAGLFFLVPIVFVMPDIQSLIKVSGGQPIPSIIKSAVGTPGVALTLLIPLVVLGILCGIGCTTASSRCAWAFARDGAIPGSGWWKRIDQKLHVPLNAMMFCMVIECVLGFIYFGSEAAFNAFSGVGIICLNAAYVTPVGISLLTGRKQVRGGQFYLGCFGTLCNVVSVGWCILILPLLCMPSTLPVSVASVNYAPVVFVAAGIISGLWYWVWGHEHYVGPATNEH